MQLRRQIDKQKRLSSIIIDYNGFLCETNELKYE